MREIKFRAWDKAEKRFWSQQEMNEIGGYYYNHGVGDYGGSFILCQFTGKVDKLGREIYEGDIVRAVDEMAEKEFIGVVNYYPDICYFAISIDGNYDTHLNFTDITKDIEILGNIHQDPGLLEKEA